jgi:hypothetical protein
MGKVGLGEPERYLDCMQITKCLIMFVCLIMLIGMMSAFPDERCQGDVTVHIACWSGSQSP